MKRGDVTKEGKAGEGVLRNNDGSFDELGGDADASLSKQISPHR